MTQGALSISLGEQSGRNRKLPRIRLIRFLVCYSHRRTLEKVDQVNATLAEPRPCATKDAAEMYKEMSDYSANAFLRGASIVQKLLLLSLAQCVKRAGVPEVPVEEVSSGTVHTVSRAPWLTSPVRTLPDSGHISLVPVPSSNGRLVVLASSDGTVCQLARTRLPASRRDRFSDGRRSQ